MNLDVVIGIAAIAIAVLALVYHVRKVRSGHAPPRSLVNEIFHDLGLVLIGVALLLPRDSALRLYLFGAFVIVFLVYLARRFVFKGSGREPETGA